MNEPIDYAGAIAAMPKPPPELAEAFDAIARLSAEAERDALDAIARVPIGLTFRTAE